MRAIVVGGAGFLGSHIIDRLIQDHIEVLCIDKLGCNTAYLDKLKVPIIYGDIGDKESIKKHLRKGDLVFHVAAILGAANASWNAYEKVNVNGTKNVFDAALEKEASAFLFMSTYGVYGPQGSLDDPLTEDKELKPYSYYDKSKYLGEKYIEEKGQAGNICCIIFRAPVIFGPRANPKSGTGILFSYLRSGIFATFGNTKQMFSVCYVKNLANAFVYFAKKHKEGIHIYNMANYPVDTFEKFLSEVRTHYEFRVLKIPASIGLLLIDISESISKMTHTAPVIPKDFILGLVSDAYNSSISKAISQGYEQEYSIEQGVKETVAHLNKDNHGPHTD